MGVREEACERLLENIEDAILSLERGTEECAGEEWELFPPEELEELIDKLRDIAVRLNVKVAQVDTTEIDE